MDIKGWYKDRGLRYVSRRGVTLLQRYDMSPARAAHRICDLLRVLGEYNCLPTFPTPGNVVERYPDLVHQIQDAGAEIAVHGYYHINLNTLPAAVARQQLLKAVATFARFGIEVHGMRCPYLGCTDELLDSLPNGLFEYSSNRAIALPLRLGSEKKGNRNGLFQVLGRFYQSRFSAQEPCVPFQRSNMVEIPLCIPDDLQMHDGLGLQADEMARAWIGMLTEMHCGGELLNILFHPELALSCTAPFVALLNETRRLQPGVWIARLRDVSAWWNEKSHFAVAITDRSTELDISFACTERATILVRGLAAGDSIVPWDGKYYQLHSNQIRVPAWPRPFVGLDRSAPPHLGAFLKDQGYIVEQDEMAQQCAVYLDPTTLAKIVTHRELDRYVEASEQPLVRYWRWPHGMKSALCLTGDLDALALTDYALRLFLR